jgi:hypothetical protein
MKQIYLPFQEARDFIRKLNFKARRDWVLYRKSGQQPLNIPSHPERIYEDKGWSGIGDWLGTGKLKYSEINYRSFEDARAFVHALKLKKVKEWKEYCRSGQKPDDIPAGPERMYANQGWKGIGDWIGTGSIYMGIKGNRKYLPYSDANKFILTLNLQTK